MGTNCTKPITKYRPYDDKGNSESKVQNSSRSSSAPSFSPPNVSNGYNNLANQYCYQEHVSHIKLKKDRRDACNSGADHDLYPDTRRPGPPTNGNNNYNKKVVGSIGNRNSIYNGSTVMTKWKIPVTTILSTTNTLFSDSFCTFHRIKIGADEYDETIKWQMMLKPYDFTADTISLYLKCLSSEDQRNNHIKAINAKFSFGVGMNNIDKSSDSNIVLEHTFRVDECYWGLQEYINMEDIHKLITRKYGKIDCDSSKRLQSFDIYMTLHECVIVDEKRNPKSSPSFHDTVTSSTFNSHAGSRTTSVNKHDEPQLHSDEEINSCLQSTADCDLNASSQTKQKSERKKNTGQIECFPDLSPTDRDSTGHNIVNNSNFVINDLKPILISESPRIIVVDNFLSIVESDHVMKIAKPDLRRSRVASGLEIEGRTSHGTFLTGKKEKDRTITNIERRIIDFMSHDSVKSLYDYEEHPLTRAEAMQVVKYEVGQFYHEHYDNKAGQTSMRAATFMMYLCDSEGGGATYFPRAVPISDVFEDVQSVDSNISVDTDSDIMATADSECYQIHKNDPLDTDVKTNNAENSSTIEMDANSLVWDVDCARRSADAGIRIMPKKGRAVLFWSKKRDGSEDLNSIHAAETVLKGEKWIATRWLSEK